MYSEILGLVEKPVRYIGQEWNQVVKPARPGCIRVGLAFPDTYEIGMSHLGMRILYDLLNRRDDVAAERVFCPWVDMEAQLRHFGLPLVTLETRTPLCELDVLGFSLQFEMEYTNVLTMLDLGGVPLRTSERRIDHPLVVAGGPCVFSPEPMADFIDAFVIGDGEEAFPAVIDRWQALKRAGGRSRAEMLEELSQLRGVYVPSLYVVEHDPETGFDVVTGPRPGSQAPFPVRRAVVDDINRYPFPADILVPYGEIVHDRVSIEIARGCTEGCRFCQAGIIYRPVRERSPEEIIRSVSRSLEQTGYDEVSLTSLSTADYSCVTSLVKTMMDRFEQSKTAMSVSSMRVYGLTRSIAEQLARVRRTGFTIAPEAGTQRMRDRINKGVTEADIDMAARIAWEQGWKQLKMYFMIGLPTETDEDVRGIAETGIRASELARSLGRGAANVTVSTSALVPKPHSTFQWEAMDDADNLRRKQRMILDTVRPYRSVRFKYHDVDEGVVECILSRGDRRLGNVIEQAWRRGARYDSWSDHFQLGRWMDCLREENLDPGVFLRRIPLHARLPWDHIDSLVTKEYLIGDLHKSQKDRFMPACEKPFIPRDPGKTVKPLEHANLVCYDCGLECDLDAIKRERIAQRDSLLHAGDAIAAAFRGAAAPTVAAAAPVRLPVLDGIPRNGIAKRDDRATNAFEAASGTLHGELAEPGRDLSPALHLAAPVAPPAPPRRRVTYRVRFAKRDDLRWLSHLDLMRVLQRAFKRAGIRIAYSQGFHPGPVMSFGPALAVGIEGLGELFDFESPDEVDTAAALERLNASLPQHLRILELERLASGAAPLSRCIDLGDYRAWINSDRQRLTPDLFSGFDVDSFANPGWQAARIREFLGRERVEIVRQRGDMQKQIDLRPYVRSIEHRGQSDASPHGDVLLQLRLGSQGQARPQEVLHQLYGLAGECFRVQRVWLGSESALEPAESVPAIS